MRDALTNKALMKLPTPTINLLPDTKQIGTNWLTCLMVQPEVMFCETLRIAKFCFDSADFHHLIIKAFIYTVDKNLPQLCQFSYSEII